MICMTGRLLSRADTVVDGPMPTDGLLSGEAEEEKAASAFVLRTWDDYVHLARAFGPGSLSEARESGSKRERASLSKVTRCFSEWHWQNGDGQYRAYLFRHGKKSVPFEHKRISAPGIIINNPKIIDLYI